MPWMRRETGIVIAFLAVGLVAAIVVLARSGSGGDTARDIGVRLDLVEDGPLQLRLGGQLWRGRTERDEDGAPDVAYVPRGAPLTIGATGRDGRRPSAVEVLIDGRVVARRRLCRASPCATSARTTLKPGRAARLGLHRVTVLARGGAPGELAPGSR